jgi:cytochrome c oxidase accessory protein FixG
MSANAKTPYRYKRYVFFVILTIISLALPFIKIDGSHFFLLSFDHKQLHLLFTTFDMQEMYLMPFVLILLFLGIFFITTLGGRIWCGWGCPQTIFRVIYRDLIQTKLLGIHKSIKNKQKPVEGKYLKRAIGVAIWSVLSLVASANFIWYFVPPEDFFKYMQNPAEHGVLVGFLVILTLFLIYDVIRLKEDFCVYICPYSRVQSVMFDEETVITIYDENRGGQIYDGQDLAAKNLKELKANEENPECTYCKQCVTVCPTHIDIRKGLQLECINCLECVDACTSVMGALGKETLVNWSSPQALSEKRKPKYARFRTIAYGVALTIALIGLFLMGTTKENMLLNINKSTENYTIRKNAVQNSYIFLFQNTDSKPHTYYFKIEDRDDIIIKRPKDAIELKSGEKLKEIVVLETKKVLVQNNQKDTPVPITIRAFATDDKNITVTRKTNFFFPRFDIYQSKIDK